MSKIRRNPFEDALAAAEKRLQEALQERSGTQTRLTQLMQEIPHLERTIAALKAQLNPKESPIDKVEIHGVTADHRVTDKPIVEIPEEVLQQLPADYLQDAKPGDPDGLPQIEGKDLLKK